MSGSLVPNAANLRCMRTRVRFDGRCNICTQHTHHVDTQVIMVMVRVRAHLRSPLREHGNFSLPFVAIGWAWTGEQLGSTSAVCWDLDTVKLAPARNLSTSPTCRPVLQDSFQESGRSCKRPSSLACHLGYLPSKQCRVALFSTPRLSLVIVCSRPSGHDIFSAICSPDWRACPSFFCFCDWTVGARLFQLLVVMLNQVRVVSAQLVLFAFF